jgi:hypothetical protein
MAAGDQHIRGGRSERPFGCIGQPMARQMQRPTHLTLYVLMTLSDSRLTLDSAPPAGPQRACGSSGDPGWRHSLP